MAALHRMIYTLLIVILAVASIAAASRLMPLDYEFYNTDSEDSLRSLFEAWIVEHSKDYHRGGEKEEKFEVFKDNVNRINHHNTSPSSYKLGLTQFADLTALHLSVFTPSTHQEQTSTFRYRNTIPPASMDWRTKGAVTPVKNQGKCGSCWAFSAVGSTEGIHQISTGKLVPLSEQELVSCDVTRNTVGCGGASNLSFAFEWMIRNGGLDSEADYPYNGTDAPCLKPKEKKVAAQISKVELFPKSETDLQKAVANQPVTGIYEAGFCGFVIEHGVVAVGYGSDKGLDYWLLKNSWGTKWGEHGYIRLERNVNSTGGTCLVASEALYPVI